MLKSRPLRSHPSGPSSPCPLPRTPGGPGTNLAVMQSGGRRGAGGDRGPETPGEGGGATDSFRVLGRVPCLDARPGLPSLADPLGLGDQIRRCGEFGGAHPRSPRTLSVFRPLPSPSRLALFQVAALAEPSPRTGQIPLPAACERRRLTWRVPVPSSASVGPGRAGWQPAPLRPAPPQTRPRRPFISPSPARAAQSCGGSRRGAGVAAQPRARREPIRTAGSRDAAATGQTQKGFSRPRA